jgi:hypothetical protein
VPGLFVISILRSCSCAVLADSAALRSRDWKMDDTGDVTPPHWGGRPARVHDVYLVLAVTYAKCSMDLGPQQLMQLPS